MSVSAVQWSAEGFVAKLACGPLRGQVEPAAVGEWFRALSWRDRPIEVFALAVSAGEPLDYNQLQRHIRGADLVHVFPKSSAERVAREAYWRAAHHAARGAVQVELIYSAQTDLLDSNPETNVSTSVAGGRVFRCQDLNAGCFAELRLADYPGLELVAVNSREHLVLFRNEALGFSYAEMVHPTDYVRSNLFSNDRRSMFCVSVLFPERLEKGVIRRGRVCGWFLPAEDDLATAVELAKQFVDEPLPLTA